jgi:hypothetical protein
LLESESSNATRIFLYISIVIFLLLSLHDVPAR